MGRQILQVFLENRLAVVGLFVIVFFILFCFVGPLLYHTNQTNSELALNANQNAAPSGGTSGTDDTGFDMLGRLMFGGQASLIVGFASAAVATVVGVLYGAVAGYIGGWVDAIMMRIVDVLALGPGALPLDRPGDDLPPVRGPHHLRDRVRQLAGAGPARARRDPDPARARIRPGRAGHGGSRTRIVGRHIVPNAIGTIVVFATFQVADSILLLAALGFIGLGIPAPGTDWGTMLSDGVNMRPRLLVGDLPGRTLHRLGGDRLQLHRRRLAGRARSAPAAALSVSARSPAGPAAPLVRGAPASGAGSGRRPRDRARTW